MDHELCVAEHVDALEANDIFNAKIGTGTPVTAPYEAPREGLWRRFRSAITGRYVTDEYADANPTTTVAEAAGERAPDGQPCRTPDGRCANRGRCDRHGVCCWETYLSL